MLSAFVKAGLVASNGEALIAAAPDRLIWRWKPVTEMGEEGDQ